ncbi:hypothetical protein [Nocardia wallacei]|uniref:hypothetical protein n=1 Tax=Nocardia wallacei TaxID=480035 RepID=UPI00245811FA|nr:hypothetical protein [Nocardia wallacei]
MSDNASEVDQIAGELNSLGHKVNQLISTWRRNNPTASRVPRHVRRDINRLITADNREREFAHAQERTRVERQMIEYRWKLARDREIRSWDTQATWFERQRQLAVEHERLRGSIYTSHHLTATERGRADRALAGAHRNPNIPIGRVFRKTRGLDALKARVRDGFTRLRAGWLTNPAERQRMQQWQQLHVERALQAPYGLDRPTNPAPAVTAAATQKTEQRPTVTVQDVTQRINLYREVMRYRSEYTGDTPEEMRPFDRDNARMRDRILTDARQLGPDQAALAEAALASIEHAHEPASGRTSAAATVERRAAQQNPAEQAPNPAGQEQAERDRGYEVTVGTAEFLREHPELADRAAVGSLADGHTWALDQLADDSKGWPANAELKVEIRRAGANDPVHQATGPRGMVIDEVVAWQTEHEQTPTAEIERLRTELHEARTENSRLRVENTDLVRKFAEHDPARRSVPTPQTPTGPRLAKPVFAGPVISQPVLNGLDR